MDLTTIYRCALYSISPNVVSLRPARLGLVAYGAKKERMLLSLKLPKLSPYMSDALIETVYAQPGAELAMGAKVFDLSVDLSSAFAQDCPPISYYRMVLRERAWLRGLERAPGQRCGIDALMAILSTEPDEPLESSTMRPVRLATAGIIYHPGMWSGSQTCEA